jgi:hypothetical protein
MNYKLHLCFCYINIHMNEYQQLQAIYEGWQGLSRDTAPNDRYTAASSNHSYRGSLPFSSGGSDNLYARMATNTGVVPVESEEEPIDGEISKQAIVVKINELVEVANDKGETFWIHALSSLREFVKKG